MVGDLQEGWPEVVAMLNRHGRQSGLGRGLVGGGIHARCRMSWVQSGKNQKHGGIPAGLLTLWSEERL